jgi:hypothetical protein
MISSSTSWEAWKDEGKRGLEEIPALCPCREEEALRGILAS